MTFSSGCAATTNLLLMMKSGDHLITFDDVYGGTSRLFRQCFEKFGISNDFIDFNTQNIEDYIRKETKMIFFETPTNPLLKIADI